MANMHMVRHGQASFGADNYDQLSPLGAQQCQRLGQHFAQQGLRFDAVLTGTLQRHAQSLAALATALPGLPPAQVLPGLDEYNPQAIVQALHPQPLPRGDSAELRRLHFGLLREALVAWMEGRTRPQGMATFADFAAGVAGVLAQVRGMAAQQVLVVSSGGPISVALGQVLGLAPQATVELNMRMRNSAVSELAFNPKRHALVTYNTLPHLQAPEQAGWVTHA